MPSVGVAHYASAGSAESGRPEVVNQVWPVVDKPADQSPGLAGPPSDRMTCRAGTPLVNLQKKLWLLFVQPEAVPVLTPRGGPQALGPPRLSVLHVTWSGGPSSLPRAADRRDP